MRVVIVGGVAGGMSAATRLRRLDEAVEIVVIEKSPYVSYANCGLPYYVGGVIEDRDALLLQTPTSLWNRFRIDVRTGQEVSSIDRAAQSVTIHTTGTGDDYTLDYDWLILSTGASAKKPAGIDGIRYAKVLRSVADADALHALSTVRGFTNAVIIGGGFIGLELSENLVRRGLTTHIVQSSATVLSQFDPEMVLPVQRSLRDNGVILHTSTTAAEIREDSVVLSDGSVIDNAVTIVATGVTPDTELAIAAGLEVGPGLGLIVDEQLRTSDPHILAVGDAVEKLTRDGGRLIALANLANRHGRMAADVIAGLPVKAKPAVGTGIIGVFGIAAGITGLTERALRGSERNFHVLHIHPNSHATYYPGAQQMQLKLIIDADTGLILGAQAVGRDGVDKRIDVIATAMAGGLTADELMDLELAYAPQFGSAKDAVNMAGYVADNLLAGTTETLQWHELDAALAAGATLVDVRTLDEFEASPIPNSINIPLDELRERAEELRDTTVVLHCQAGQRGHTAVRILAGHGITAKNLDGGWLTWRDTNTLT